MLFQEASELAYTLDTATYRHDICAWRQTEGGPAGQAWHQEAGYRRGYYRRQVTDKPWPLVPFPCELDLHREAVPAERRYRWCRTRFFLPATAANQPVNLTFGGYGLFDFDFMQVFLNGRRLGSRRIKGDQRQPGVFRLLPGTPLYWVLRFGGDNVLALQLRDYYCRPPELAAVDPQAWMIWKTPPFSPVLFDQQVTVGQPETFARLPFQGWTAEQQGRRGQLRLQLGCPGKVRGEVVYEWNTAEPILLKRTRLINETAHPLALLDIDLFNGRPRETNPATGELGFPLLGDNWFITADDPAVFSRLSAQQAVCRLFLGEPLPAGAALDLPTVLFGFAAPGQAVPAFRQCVRLRSRRRRRNHLRSISNFFPVNPGEDFSLREDFLRAALETLAGMKKNKPGLPFEFFFNGYFTIDNSGDFIDFDGARWPRGPKRYLAELRRLGLKLGMGYSASVPPHWSIGDNLALGDCNTRSLGWGLCNAAEPYRSLVRRGMTAYRTRYGMEYFTVDEFSPLCFNPHHGHRTGKYSINANFRALRELLELLDRLHPDLFISLWWGFRSPWWLKHADVLFEPSGIDIEARNPSEQPCLHFRDSITLGLDRAHAFAKCIPQEGKDSLGIWLTPNAWNSYVGAARWQAGFVMDMGRGSLLGQLWGDMADLSAGEWEEANRFFTLLRSAPACFANSRLVVGDPWHGGVYGYCAADGNRGFLMLNNSSWEEGAVQLKLGPDWNLGRQDRWQLIRWWPKPAVLTGKQDAPLLAPGTVLHLRPFEIILLEVIAPGLNPTLPWPELEAALPPAPAEPARPLAATAKWKDPNPKASLPNLRATSIYNPDMSSSKTGKNLPIRQLVELSATVPATSLPAVVSLIVEMRKHGRPARIATEYRSSSVAHLAVRASLAGRQIRMLPSVRRATVPWQVFAMAVSPANRNRRLRLQLTSWLPRTLVELDCRIRFLPDYPLPAGSVAPATRKTRKRRH